MQPSWLRDSGGTEVSDQISNPSLEL